MACLTTGGFFDSGDVRPGVTLLAWAVDVLWVTSFAPVMQPCTGRLSTPGSEDSQCSQPRPVQGLIPGIKYILFPLSSEARVKCFCESRCFRMFALLMGGLLHSSPVRSFLRRQCQKLRVITLLYKASVLGGNDFSSSSYSFRPSA